MNEQKSVRAFAPASVSNLACAFDIMGFAVEGLGDEVLARLLESPAGEDSEQVVVEGLTGDGDRLPREASRNTASVAAMAILVAMGSEKRVGLQIHKKMPLSSGLGSSAASAVAAVVAVDSLLDLGASPQQLLCAAMEGERVACGAAHADNVAPSLFGGLVLIRQPDPPDVLPLPVPEGLSCALVRPHVEVSTGEARRLLGDSLPLATAVRQWGNVGALVASLYQGDLDLLSRSMVDAVAEPARASLVPGFRAAQESASAAGALGCSLSGSGPTIFALCASLPDAKGVAEAMSDALQQGEIPHDRQVSRVGAAGARILG